MPKERAKMQKSEKELGARKEIRIAKPDLTKERYFNSKHTTPNESTDNAK
jgi:hypothetical protein